MKLTVLVFVSLLAGALLMAAGAGLIDHNLTIVGDRVKPRVSPPRVSPSPGVGKLFGSIKREGHL